MKKKFGELTVKEICEICANHGGCFNCPLYEVCPKRFTAPEDWKEDLDVKVKL